VLDILVTEISVQRPRIVPSVGEGIAAGVSEHVRVRLEAELRLDPRSPGRGERAEFSRLKVERAGRRRPRG
jgi:hypothetical protein